MPPLHTYLLYSRFKSNNINSFTQAVEEVGARAAAAATTSALATPTMNTSSSFIFFIVSVYATTITITLGCYLKFDQKAIFENIKSIEMKRTEIMLENNEIARTLNYKLEVSDKFRNTILEVSLNVRTKKINLISTVRILY